MSVGKPCEIVLCVVCVWLYICVCLICCSLFDQFKHEKGGTNLLLLSTLWCLMKDWSSLGHLEVNLFYRFGMVVTCARQWLIGQSCRGKFPWQTCSGNSGVSLLRLHGLKVILKTSALMGQSAGFWAWSPQTLLYMLHCCCCLLAGALKARSRTQPLCSCTPPLPPTCSVLQGCEIWGRAQVV